MGGPNKDALIAQAAEQGIEVPEGATKADIQALLDAAPSDTDTGDGDDQGDLGNDTETQADVDEAARAVALAALANGGDTDDVGSVGEPDTSTSREAPSLTGVVHEWGGDRAYLVTADLFHHRWDGDRIDTARRGDVVKLQGKKAAARGVSLGSLVETD